MSLDDVVRGLDLRGSADFAFLDLLSGELLVFSREELELAESERPDGDIPAAQREQWRRRLGRRPRGWHAAGSPAPDR